MSTQPPPTPLTPANPPEGNNLPAPPNNSPHPAPSSSRLPVPGKLPHARHWSRSVRWLITLVVLAVVAGGSVAGWYLLTGKNNLRPDLLLHKVKKEKLQVTIVERGNLESAENNEIICQVKARSQQSNTAST